MLILMSLGRKVGIDMVAFNFIELLFGQVQVPMQPKRIRPIPDQPVLGRPL